MELSLNEEQPFILDGLERLILSNHSFGARQKIIAVNPIHS